MANENEGFALGFFKDIEEERRLQAEEFQICYAERKQQKQERRRVIEDASGKICEAVQSLTYGKMKNMSPEELVQLAAALNHAATAMQAAEQYAEFTPYYSGGFCAV